MLKGEFIKGYQILQDFSTAGGGLSKWTFARKNGKVFFFKEFLSPKYPTKDAPGNPKNKAKKRKDCEQFERHHKELMKQINEKCGSGGNLVYTVEFFRNESKYYKVTEKVDVASLSVEEIASLPLSARVLILKTIAHSLGVLHKADIVHGDLKPDNILIKQTKTGSYTAKLIDFDNSYFSGYPPEMSEDMVGDMVFYSPELALFIKNDKKFKAKDLTVRSDIFALGLVFCLYLQGKLADFDTAKYNYACEAVNLGEILVLEDEDIPSEIAALVNRMLSGDYRQRPFISEVFDGLKSLDLKAYPDTSSIVKNVKMTEKNNLKGFLLTESKEDIEKAEGKPSSALRGKGLDILKK